MGFKIITEYPWWFSFFCLLAGVAYSFVLYRKEKKFSELSVWIIRALVFFRFMTVSILAFLLLSSCCLLNPALDLRFFASRPACSASRFSSLAAALAAAAFSSAASFFPSAESDFSASLAFFSS